MRECNISGRKNPGVRRASSRLWDVLISHRQGAGSGAPIELLDKTAERRSCGFLAPYANASASRKGFTFVERLARRMASSVSKLINARR